MRKILVKGKNGEIVLKGTMNEEWIIPQEKLAKYEYPDGAKILYDELPAEFVRIQTAMGGKLSPVWMMQIPLDITGKITTERGDVLKVNCPVNRKGQIVPHGNGDYIVCCDKDGVPYPGWGSWVVNGCVVDRTYRRA